MDDLMEFAERRASAHLGRNAPEIQFSKFFRDSLPGIPVRKKVAKLPLNLKKDIWSRLSEAQEKIAGAARWLSAESPQPVYAYGNLAFAMQMYEQAAAVLLKANAEALAGRAMAISGKLGAIAEKLNGSGKREQTSCRKELAKVEETAHSFALAFKIGRE